MRQIGLLLLVLAARSGSSTKADEPAVRPAPGMQPKAAEAPKPAPTRAAPVPAATVAPVEPPPVPPRPPGIAPARTVPHKLAKPLASKPRVTPATIPPAKPLAPAIEIKAESAPAPTTKPVDPAPAETKTPESAAPPKSKWTQMHHDKKP